MRLKPYVYVMLMSMTASVLMGANDHRVSSAAAAAVNKSENGSPRLSDLPAVPLSKELNVKLKEVQSLAQDKETIITYTLSYTNSSAQAVSLIPYFSKWVSVNGKEIKGKPLPAYAAVQKVSAKDTVSIQYYVKAGKESAVGGKIQLYAWDFALSEYERKIGAFAIPAAYSESIAVGKSKKLAAGGEIKARSLQIFTFRNKKYARVGLSLAGLEKTETFYPNMALSLRSADGSLYKLNKDSSRSLSSSALQQQTRDYFAEIPDQMKSTDLTLQVTEYDSTLALNLPFASFRLPKAVLPNWDVPAYAAQSFSSRNDGSAYEVQVADAYSDAEEQTTNWTLTLRVKNTGNKPISFADHQLSVKTPEGGIYPVNADALAKLSLKPLEEKKIRVTAAIPLDIKPNDLQLEWIEKAGEENAENKENKETIRFPNAYFSIPYSLQPNTAVGAEQSVTTDKGDFIVTLASLQRIPWGDEDLLSARVNIRNRSDKTVNLPKLKGAMTLDRMNMADVTELVRSSGNSILKQGQSAEYTLFTPFPADAKFNRLQLDLLDAQSEELPFIRLNTTDYTLADAPTLASEGTYEMGSEGKRASVKERTTRVYQANGATLLYTEVIMTSKEKRPFDPGRLFVSYLSKDGKYYEAKHNQPAGKLNPDGQTLISIWSKLPSSVNPSDLQLYLGEEIKPQEASQKDAEAIGVIHTAILPLSKNGYAPQQGLSSVSFYPYRINVWNAAASILEHSTTVNLNFSYELTQDQTYDMGEFGHTLILRFTDPSGQQFEKTLKPGTDLSLGFGNETFTYSSPLYTNIAGGPYTLTLIDQFQGARSELAKQTGMIAFVPEPKPKDEQSEQEDVKKR